MADAEHLIATSASQLDIAKINREFRASASANNWQAYHNPKNLAAAVSVEAAELLAEFQWLSEAESCSLSAPKKLQVAGEIADIILYLTELSQRLEIDLVGAVNLKIENNKQRFKAG